MTIERYEGPRSLERFGIYCLTGEACGLAMRVLCDLDDNGANVWRQFTRTEPTVEAWNSKGKFSAMIPYVMLESLWLFACVLEDKAVAVFTGGYIGKNDWHTVAFGTKGSDFYEEIELPVESWSHKNMSAWACFDHDSWLRFEHLISAKVFYITRSYKKSTHPGTGIDNTHAMSGRTI